MKRPIWPAPYCLSSVDLELNQGTYRAFMRRNP